MTARRYLPKFFCWTCRLWHWEDSGIGRKHAYNRACYWSNPIRSLVRGNDNRGRISGYGCNHKKHGWHCIGFPKCPDYAADGGTA